MEILKTAIIVKNKFIKCKLYVPEKNDKHWTEATVITKITDNPYN